MSDQTEVQDGIIKLLPPEISNKIAAGEVVQRPSSVLKELLDNAIDSGADSIKIIIQGAGKTLVQVIDNGCGMAKDDIQNCFLRHATSKIKNVDDLYRIMTLGFRGEAMASIGSVAQVTLTTKQVGDSSGWEYELWGGEEKKFEPTATDDGTSVAVRNLFFNVPARRAFLKTDATEFRHILLTFQQAALSHTDIAFELVADGDVVYKLPRQRLSDRITELFGKSYKASLIPVEEKTSMVSLHGYLLDPKMAKKTRGEQFLFVNGRPFMHRHLNYIIQDVYNTWVSQNHYPFYAIFFEIDPELVDVNVHPSKLEVKFEDERSISTFTRSIVKKSLNERFRVPTLEQLDRNPPPQKSGSSFENDFRFSKPQSGGGNWSSGGFSKSTFKKPGTGDFSDALYKMPSKDADQNEKRISPVTGEFQKPVKNQSETTYWQLHNQYIISQTLSGMCIVDQNAAHKRIMYERSLNAFESGIPSTQQLLFPQNIELSASDFELLKNLRPDMEQMGFHLQLLSGNTAMITGVPSDIQAGNEKDLLEKILQQYQSLSERLKISSREKLAIAFANRTSIPRGKRLTQLEMDTIMDQLFSCSEPYSDPMGRPTINYIPLDEIKQRF